jgi:HK97 family phage major capsid protein
MPLDIELKGALDGIRDSVTTFKTRQDEMQSQLDAIDKKMVDRIGLGSAEPDLIEELKQNDSVARLLHDKKGAAIITLTGAKARLLERKTTITSSAAGSQTTGVLQIDRIPGITPEARQVLTIRDVFTATPTTLQIIDFVKVSSAMSIASPQTEANTKAENAVTFTPASERIRTIATWIPATRQILDDFQELANFINTTLRYYVDLAEELQLVAGDGTGENLNGLIPQASNFNTALLSASAGWNKIDVIGRAIQQLSEAKEINPSFVVLNPRDWNDMRLTKDQFGRYILGDPQATVMPMLFNRTVIETTSIDAGTFLVGSGDQAAAEIRDRMETQIEISTSHSDYFVKNLVAVRGEKRVALIVKRPNAFVNGTFTTSPA